MTRYRRASWDPFRELLRLRDEVGSLIEGTGFGVPFLAERGDPFPRVNVVCGEEESVLYAEVPGVALEDLDVTVKGTTLTVKGERKPGAEIPEERHYRRERGSGPFGRSIQLPHKVDLEGVEAGLTDGILKVRLPKAPEVKPCKIAVRT